MTCLNQNISVCLINPILISIHYEMQQSIRFMPHSINLSTNLTFLDANHVLLKQIEAQVANEQIIPFVVLWLKLSF